MDNLIHQDHVRELTDKNRSLEKLNDSISVIFVGSVVVNVLLTIALIGVLS
jgi:hypothetical protein